MKRQLHRAATIIVLFMSVWAAQAEAQETVPAAERLRNLERRLEELQQQNESLRAEIEALKDELAQTPETAEEQTSDVEDLTAIDVADSPEPTAAEAASETPAPDDLPADVVQNQSSPATRGLNPDIAVIGNFVGKAGGPNEFEERDSLSMDETEISFQAFVDPYARAKFFVAVGPEGAELEEASVDFISLPHDLTARVGKLKASFGKVNQMHTHVRKWVDQPLVIKNFFGDEGLADSGISVSRIFPNRFNVFVEGTAEVFRGDVDGVFESGNLNDLVYLAHLKSYRDLTERSNLELGASSARGTAPETGGANEFAGFDVSYRYKPLERSIYRSFIARSELISNRREENDDRAFGFYASADYQFARRWFAGVRVDRADRPETPDVSDDGASLTLTFWPSEFSQIRGQARRMNYGNGPDVNELLFQLQFSIGAHGAHTF